MLYDPKNTNIHLGPLSFAHLDEIMLWINDPDVNRNVMRVLPIMREHEAVWLRDLATSHKEIVFGIFFVADVHQKNKLIGTCGIHHISWTDRTATLGIAIGDKSYWGQKIGSTAYQLLITYAFDSLNLFRLSSIVFAFNERSIALHKKIGFVEEGIERESVYREGKRYDVIHFGLLANEYVKK